MSPDEPTRSEGENYLQGRESAWFAIELYSKRRMVSAVTAEDRIRGYLTDLGFKELPEVYIPREN